ncbi:HAMP domain-containing histidine kinase [Fulvivirga maritima]|uniref:sensor histidine kinase n=1 Tax=Fulvivirga maritima TaxID=2904247 RepID=UPI001F3A05BA|nr:HAMP domain-containing sensor histidine kinase [Fulvivirga maritima]UII24987.1 HAMP domain-containing histidine kinase [Fulvivirga maritima]
MPYVDNAILDLSALNQNSPASRENVLQVTKPVNEKTSENTLEFNHLVHDLKSPVNSLKGIVELANINLKGDDAQEYLSMIKNCVNSLENRITSTLDMYERGTLSSDGELIDFNQLINNIMSSMEHIEGFDDVDFEVNIDLHRPFYASRATLESVLQNLFENAIKYRCGDTRHCKVKVQVINNEEGVEIRFSDNGIGISDDKLPHIFDAHFKSDQHKSSNGLGLFIVKKAVEKLRGDLKVHSKEGRGTTFLINLPDLNN